MNSYINVEYMLCASSLNVSRIKLNSGIARNAERMNCTQRSRRDIWWQLKKKSNMNKCFGIQLKLHDISWWLVRIFIHVQWTMDSIYLSAKRTKKKCCMKLHEIASVKWHFLLFRVVFFHSSPRIGIQSIESKRLSFLWLIPMWC